MATLLPVISASISSSLGLSISEESHSITPSRITNLDSGKDHIHAADSVVLISGNESNRGLVDVLEEYAGEVFVTGDAVASRPMEKAIHDGHYAALRISDNQIVIPSTAILSQTSNPLSGE